MMELDEHSGFSAFALWNAIKLHFTSNSYNFFKYNGKTNISKQSFSTNKNKYSFYKLSRKYSNDELKDYFVSNFIERNVNWIGDITNDDGEENYKKWLKRNQSLTYYFEQDIYFLFQSGDSPDSLLKVNKGEYPKLLSLAMSGDITLETFIILQDILGFFDEWNKKISDDIVWPQFRNKCEKYLPFIHYDKKKYRNLLKKKIKEIGEAA